MSSHKYIIEAVAPLTRGWIFVTFTDGEVRLYDVKNMIEEIPAFESLCSDEQLFSKAAPDSLGLGIVWNDYFDLASDEIYERGIHVEKEVA